jgi:regulatory protein
VTAKAPRPDAGPAERLERALELAYRHLARRDRTVLEVRRHLVSRGVDEDTVEAALAELAVQGYLDDARYAARFAEDRRSIDAWGGERIARGLLDAGVAREHVEAALRDREEEAEELEAAVAVLRRRLPEPPSTDRARERALGLLVRRGYELELAYEAVRAFERHAA